jgi:acetylornithine/N-succinyldiaminopimelate aminotransferase
VSAPRYEEQAAGAGRQWLDRYAGAVMGTYGTPQRVLVRGRGAEVWDADGRRYLDLRGGIATTSLGHAHPALVAALCEQAGTLGHVSNFFATPVQVTLAERLCALLHAPQGSRVFFCNSGAEANETALKMARRTGRPRVLAATGGFHGRTMGALSMTHKPAIRQPFEPLVPGVEHVPFGDVEALAAALADTGRGEVAAVVLEPVQGEAGVLPAPDGYLAAARRLTRQHGALLVLDEVQTGIARTGAWFAHQVPGLGLDGDLPDVVTLAKGLGGGVPVGAAVALGAGPGALLGAGDHGTTFGGNPIAAAAALAVLDTVEAEGLLGRARALGDRLADGVLALGHPLVAGVRGVGLLRAVLLAAPASARVATHALEAGVIVNAVAPDAVRLAPPLVLTDVQADEVLAALPAVLDAAAADLAGSRA